VSAAPQIKAEVNATLQAGKKARAGEALRYPKDTEDKYHHDCDDGDCFPEKVLFHGNDNCYPKFKFPRKTRDGTR